jgi:hypothetical protein
MVLPNWSDSTSSKINALRQQSCRCNTGYISPQYFPSILSFSSHVFMNTWQAQLGMRSVHSAVLFSFLTRWCSIESTRRGEKYRRVIIARYEKRPCKEYPSADGLGCKSQHNREVVNHGLEFLHSWRKPKETHVPMQGATPCRLSMCGRFTLDPTTKLALQEQVTENLL